MTNSECTPPSRTPLLVNLKRTSRIGPLVDRKAGTTFFAPMAVARATCGFTAGEEPPCVGKAWQPTQLSRLQRGPRPSPMFSSSLKFSCPLRNSVAWSGVRPGTGLPAVSVALVGLTPGSTAAAFAVDAPAAQLNSVRKTAPAAVETCDLRGLIHAPRASGRHSPSRIVFVFFVFFFFF